MPVPCGRSKDGERQIARTALGSNSSESIANACFLPFPGSKAFGLSALALNSGKPRRTAGSRGIHRPKITRNQQARGLDTHLPSNPTDGMRYEIGAYFFSFGSQNKRKLAGAPLVPANALSGSSGPSRSPSRPHTPGCRTGPRGVPGGHPCSGRRYRATTKSGFRSQSGCRRRNCRHR